MRKRLWKWFVWFGKSDSKVRTEWVQAETMQKNTMMQDSIGKRVEIECECRYRTNDMLDKTHSTEDVRPKCTNKRGIRSSLPSVCSSIFYSSQEFQKIIVHIPSSSVSASSISSPSTASSSGATTKLLNALSHAWSYPSSSRSHYHHLYCQLEFSQAWYVNSPSQRPLSSRFESDGVLEEERRRSWRRCFEEQGGRVCRRLL